MMTLSKVDLDLIYGKVKFGSIDISIGKSENSGFFRKYSSLWPENWYMQTTNWVNEGKRVLKVTVTSWPWPKVIYVWKVKTSFSQIQLGHFEPNFVCKLSGTRKFHKHYAGHMSKMAAMPLYGKNPSINLFLLNWWTDFIETWYVASGNLVCSPGLTLT